MAVAFNPVGFHPVGFPGKISTVAFPNQSSLWIFLVGSDTSSMSLSGVRTTSMSMVGSDTSSISLKGS